MRKIWNGVGAWAAKWEIGGYNIGGWGNKMSGSRKCFRHTEVWGWRRTLQLLSLMYLHKSDPTNLRTAARNTRSADCDQFYVERYNTCKYKNSPYYKGSELWKLLPLHIANSDSLFQFKLNFKKEYKSYVNTLF